MKKIGIIVILVLVTQGILAQETQTVDKLSPSLRLFLQDYHNYLFNIIEIDSTDTDLLQGKGFFMDDRDTLRWPRLLEEADKMYKSRIGPETLNNEVDQLIKKYRETHNYLGFNMNNIEIREIIENKLYTKYKLLVNQQFTFSESDNYNNIKLIEKPFYYEVINYFNPENLFLGVGSQSTGYVYRINNIAEKAKYGRFSPQVLSLNNRIGTLTITKNDLYKVENALNFTTMLEADWLLGGNNYWQFLFKTGLGFGWNSFQLQANQYSANFADLNLYDKDGFPFELLASGEQIRQKITYNDILLPVIFRFEHFFRDKNFSLSFYAGSHLRYVTNYNMSQTSGSYNFQGKYKFDFFSAPVVLSELPDYNYRTYSFDDPGLSAGATDIEKFQVSAVAGLEARYYFARNLTANAGFTYSKSILPLFENPVKKISFNVAPDAANAGASSFQPAANPLFVANDKTMADVLGFTFGVSYFLTKPLIPYTHKGLSKGQLTRQIKNLSVLPGMKETGKPVKKEVNFIVNQLRGSSESFRFSYIGPEPEYFQQGKIHSGKQRENKLSFLVPQSENARIFLEEPYGYELKLGDLPFEELGDFHQIKAVKVGDVWQKDKFYSKLEFSLSELEDYDIYLFYYDRMGDDENSGLTALTNYIDKEIKPDRKSIFYIVSSSPLCTMDKEEIGSRLFTSREIPNDPNIEFLKDYLKEKQLNMRRKINFKIVMPEIGFYKIPRLISRLPEILQIDYNSLKFQVVSYKLGGYVNEDEIQQIRESLKNSGIIINNL